MAARLAAVDHERMADPEADHLFPRTGAPDLHEDAELVRAIQRQIGVILSERDSTSYRSVDWMLGIPDRRRMIEARNAS
jgi:hypothetical protein